MRTRDACFVALLGVAIFPMQVQAQVRQAEIAISVPRLVNISGEYRPADGGAPVPFETVTLRVYSEANGGAPLWEETQTVSVDSAGRYSLMLGATQKDGIPQQVFSSSDAQWLAISWARDGGAEGARIRLTSVPYALRAADAETFGGLPPSAYQLAAPYGGRVVGANALAASAGASAPAGEGIAATPSDAAKVAVAATPKAVNNGIAGYLAKYVNTTDVGASAIYELNGMVGFNTTTPADIIHSRFTNTDGTLTGLAVQNLANGANSYSGMLFYDNLGAVAQFQGFNNSTHEYRINNIASSGSMSFMLASTPVLKLVGPNRVLVNSDTAETGAKTKAVLEVQSPTTSNGVFIRKSGTDTFTPGLALRSGTGTTGPLLQAIVGSGDSYAIGGVDYVIEAINNNTNGYGVYGSGGGTGYGGYFYPSAYVNGNLTVSGTISKGGGSFKIDHPLDPENKYLLHSFVESPDMMNVYNGNVVLDSEGSATIALPEWFEALNRDFRYQLTPLGPTTTIVYVAQKIAGNQFRIAGGTPGGEVSWQVTGIRQDAWANHNRIPVELAKGPNEKGKYLHPAAYDLPEEKGIDPGRAVRTPVTPPEARPR